MIDQATRDWTPALRDRVRMRNGLGNATIVAVGTEGSALGLHRVRLDNDGSILSRVPVDAMERLVEVPASAQSGHLDGGARALDASEAPVPMCLTCPSCSGSHVDRGEWATRSHKTHLCEHCGHLWRPFPWPTTGIEDAEEAVDAAIEAVRKGER